MPRSSTRCQRALTSEIADDFKDANRLVVGQDHHRLAAVRDQKAVWVELEGIIRQASFVAQTEHLQFKVYDLNKRNEAVNQRPVK